MNQRTRDPEVKGIPVPFSVRMAQLHLAMIRFTEAVKRAMKGECNWHMVSVYFDNVEDAVTDVRVKVKRAKDNEERRLELNRKENP